MKKSHDKRSGNLPTYIFILLFISGVVAGALAAYWAENSVLFQQTGSGRMSVFTESFKSFLKPCVFIWISGFTGISVYLSALALAYRGGIFGFVTCMIIKTGGTFAAVSATLPQNIIYFPFLLFLSLAATGQDRNRSTNYMIMLVLSLFVCALSALLDTLITRTLINFTF